MLFRSNRSTRLLRACCRPSGESSGRAQRGWRSFSRFSFHPRAGSRFRPLDCTCSILQGPKKNAQVITHDGGHTVELCRALMRLVTETKLLSARVQSKVTHISASTETSESSRSEKLDSSTFSTRGLRKGSNVSRGRYELTISHRRRWRRPGWSPIG